MTTKSLFQRCSGLMAMLGVAALGVAPLPAMADASNPRYVPRAAKAKAKPNYVRKAAAKPAAVKPAPPIEVAQPAPPAPAYEAPAPAVVQAPAAPAPAAAKLAVVKKGNGLLIGLLSAVGVIGGIVLATSGGSAVSR